MSERQSVQSASRIVRQTPEPADPAFVTKLQQAVMLANENCDRANALAHKLSAQLREAQDRINELELEADGLVAGLRAEVEAAIAKLKADADARVERAERRAERAEQWLVLIRREIEGHLLPSLNANQDRRTPPRAN